MDMCGCGVAGLRTMLRLQKEMQDCCTNQKSPSPNQLSLQDYVLRRGLPQIILTHRRVSISSDAKIVCFLSARRFWQDYLIQNGLLSYYSNYDILVNSILENIPQIHFKNTPSSVTSK